MHLALAESSIFRRDQNRSEASVTVPLNPGRTLVREQPAVQPQPARERRQ